MITSSMVLRYGITHIYPGYSRVDELCSGSMNDPLVAADDNASRSGFEYWDVTVAIAKDHKVETQIIVFKNKEGYERYKEDKVLIFNHEE